MRKFWQRKQKGWTALKLASDGVCYAHVERRAGDKPLVTAWACEKLDIQSEHALKAFASTHRWHGQRCAALMDRNEYQVFQVDALTVPRQELKQAIRWSIKDMLDYPVANATVDVLDIPHDTSNPARPRFMLAVAARNENIRKRIECLIERSQVDLEAIDIPELAQRNIAALLEQEGRGLAMLSFNQEGGLLTFTGGGELYHARQIDVTADMLQSSDPERRSHVYERVALDLQRSLDNFERQFPYVTINQLLLAPFAMRGEFHEYLRSYLYLQVGTFELADVFDLAEIPALQEVTAQSNAFQVLGAALREGAV